VTCRFQQAELYPSSFYARRIIPSRDIYLEKKYKDEFRDYAKKTKKFIPLIY